MYTEQQCLKVLDTDTPIATLVEGSRDLLTISAQCKKVKSLDPAPATEKIRAEHPDSLLLARIKEGDELALSLLYERYSSVVYSVSLRVLRNSAGAQDVLQEVFMQIWRNPPQFEVAEWGLSGWM